MISGLRSTPLASLLRRAFMLMVGLTVAVGIAGFVAVSVVTDHLDGLVRTYQPLAAANSAVLVDMVDAESGLRGYQLTGQAVFLAPYRSGMAALPSDLAAARSRAGDDHLVQQLLGAEEQAANRWIAGYAAPLVAAGGRSATASDAAGKHLFDRFRAANGAVAGAVSGRESTARVQADRARTAALAVLAALAAVAFAVGTWAGLRILRRAVPPLEAVTAAVRRLAAGERGVRVAEDGTAEVVALAQAVKLLDRENQRRSRLDRRQDRLRRLVSDAARDLADDLDPDTVLPRCAMTVGTAFGADRVLLRVGGPAGASDDDRVAGAVIEWRRAEVPGLDAGSSDPATALLDRLGGGVGPAIVEARGGGDEPGPGWRRDDREVPDAMAALGAQSAAGFRLDAGDGPIGSVVLLYAEPLHWSADRVAAVADVAADVARAVRRAQLYEREHRLVRELEALDRAKADFVATVSHELRTPLTSIRGYVEMMGDGTADSPAEQARMLAVIDRNSRRLQHLVDNLLTLSRIEANSLPTAERPVAVDPVLRSVAETLGPQAEAGRVTLDLSGVDSGATVAGDAAQLDQVVLNLMSNAVKFTPAGGTVTVTSRVDGGGVLVGIADTGIGIPVAEQSRLGSRFFRASNASDAAIPGTGLGLRIVFGLVERHGGRVGVESEPGRGSTFTVWLPRIGTAAPSRRVVAVGPAS